MTRETKVALATVVGMAVILAVVTPRWIAGLATAPTMSITDRPNVGDGPSANPMEPMNHPTILRADGTHSLPLPRSSEPVSSGPGFRGYLSDEGGSTWCDASSAAFLPLPSFDGPQRR